ncbi:MAG: MotA/TolQ/ExbB proton channel family protein [bacterium]|nr:MotA/TolQ/ExbB proton channel family protein [bacterium]
MADSIFVSLFNSIPLWVMIVPIVICSIILVAVFIERMIFYRRINIDYRFLIIKVKEYIRDNKKDEAKKLCANYSGPMVDMVYKTVDVWDSLDDVESGVRNFSEKSIRSIERFGGLISTIATVSPMLGLLGTVTGMMKSFSSLAQYDASAQELLARGITQALITTALGLLVAIPALMFYNYMVSKIEHYIREVEHIANSFIDISSN